MYLLGRTEEHCHGTWIAVFLGYSSVHRDLGQLRFRSAGVWVKVDLGQAKFHSIERTA